MEVGTIFVEPSMTTERIDEKRSECMQYLIRRKKSTFHSQFHYVSSAATDVKQTQREYLEQELPDMKQAYQFLYR